MRIFARFRIDIQIATWVSRVDATIRHQLLQNININELSQQQKR